MGRGNLWEVWDGSGDCLSGPGWVGGPSRRSVMGRGTLGVDLDGQENLRDVRDRSEDPW